MERIVIIALIIFGIFSFISLAISSVIITRKDNGFTGSITNEKGNPLLLTNWIESPEGIELFSKLLPYSPFGLNIIKKINNFLNEVEGNYIPLNETLIASTDDTAYEWPSDSHGGNQECPPYNNDQGSYDYARNLGKHNAFDDAKAAETGDKDAQLKLKDHCCSACAQAGWAAKARNRNEYGKYEIDWSVWRSVDMIISKP